MELEAQFRCNGSDTYIRWVDNTLELRRTPHVLWRWTDDFDFDVVGSRRGARGDLIRGRAATGSTARLVAGFCWPWSDPRRGRRRSCRTSRWATWSMPWNAKADAGRARRRHPEVRTSGRATTAGIDQVGCVYTAQGFEYDHVGVIFGPDLVYRPMEGGWVGQRDQSSDRVVRSGVTDAEFTDFVKSTYRVLLTRGLRGCYVYFMDAPTRDFFLSRIEHSAATRTAQAAELATPYDK